MSALRVRPVADADLPAIRDIYNHYVRTSTVTYDEIESTEEDWAQKSAKIAAAGIPFLVAETDAGDVLGYALGQPWSPKSAYRFTIENSIYLAPSAAGRGIGRALLAEFLDACRSAGLRQVIAVIADRGADASIALHRKAGFVDVGRLTDVGEKFGESQGVFFLQKSLPFDRLRDPAIKGSGA
ncbi:L-amino acid N-acyltransferase YncA [Microbacterium sp. W4I4]|uniref:GNAT family N-acetyltransferase n=1 Tax=Microbacterium sp. W4I4 TaxID=3042295 RepID=UPI00277F6896|nr:GNAT family N-acetyltransferase [Microbacterium sp. W4I4]MDQ0613235.1 L-amino acid N-acyltransferase YncA [Microbacterium sp. W4I4]